LVEGILKSDSLRERVESQWNGLSPKLFFYNAKLDNVTSAIRRFYVQDENESPGKTKEMDFQKNFGSLTNAFSDRLYMHASRETARIQSRYSPVYLYYFTYPLKKGLVYLYDINPEWPLVIQFVFKEIFWFIRENIFQTEIPSLGVIHGDDVALVFRFPLIGLPPGTEDFHMSRQMVKMWVDFAANP
jgi:carboxylesterase type B